MNRKLLVIGVAAVAVTAGAASANTMHHKARMGESGHFAAPSQPIPYAQLDAYLKGSRSERSRIEARAASSDTQTASNGRSGMSGMSNGMATPSDATSGGASQGDQMQGGMNGAGRGDMGSPSSAAPGSDNGSNPMGNGSAPGPSTSNTDRTNQNPAGSSGLTPH